MTSTFSPDAGTIDLTPTEDDEHIWRLTFREKDTGEDVAILLPMEQLEELYGEFRGLEQEFR